MNAADLPSSSLTSDLVTSDQAPSVFGDTRTFQERLPSKNPGSVKVFPTGSLTSAVNSTWNGLATLTSDLKTKSCGCQRGTATRLAALAEIPFAVKARRPVIKLNCFLMFILNFRCVIDRNWPQHGYQPLKPPESRMRSCFFSSE